MSTLVRFTTKSLIACGILLSLATNLYAWAPNPGDLDTAIKTGDFAAYQTNATAWLNQKAGGNTSDAALKALLKDPVFLSTLDQRQFIAKTGADKLGAFAKAGPENQAFLSWLLNNTQALDLFLEAIVPIHLGAREQNNYGISVGTLDLWKKILNSDPDAKEGLYLKVAMATAISPPGTSGRGAGQAVTPEDPIVRFKYLKAAHKNKELFPSFDKLTVWEMTKVVSSNASNADLTWAREMINAWRPDLRVNELVVNSTSEVWRRNSPIDFANSFKNVLAGGGKCGPRSSWSVMVCQAFGIPAIGVGQPAHACVAYKCANPMTEPQPGSAWKVGYGRGWQVSKLEGMGGLEFLAGVQDREHLAEFSQVEHLRWFAAALSTPAQATAIMDVAHAIQKSVVGVKTDVTASAKADEAEKELVPTKTKPVAAPISKDPVKLASGATRIEAVQFSGMQAVRVLDCYTGGKQVNFDKSIDDSWVEYTIDVASAGTYSLTMKVAAANLDQVLNVKAGANEPVTVKVPYTTGLWDMTPAAEIKLEKGRQTLRISAPNQRGVAVRFVELKAKEQRG